MTDFIGEASRGVTTFGNQNAFSEKFLAMYFYKQYLFHVYIITNPEKTVLYVGMTNNLPDRLAEHFFNRGQPKTFAGKYYCYNLVFYEEFQFVHDAIEREKELKGWTRKKKEDLINSKNPTWMFLNKEVCKYWPPKEIPRRFKS